MPGENTLRINFINSTDKIRTDDVRNSIGNIEFVVRKRNEFLSVLRVDLDFFKKKINPSSRHISEEFGGAAILQVRKIEPESVRQE